MREPAIERFAERGLETAVDGDALLDSVNPTKTREVLPGILELVAIDYPTRLQRPQPEHVVGRRGRRG